MLTIVPATSSQQLGPEVEARIRALLAALEGSIDQVIHNGAALTQAIVESRRDLRVPVHTGQSSLMRLQRLHERMVASSTDSFRIHKDLAAIGQTLMICDDPTDFKNSGLDESEPAVAAA